MEAALLHFDSSTLRLFYSASTVCSSGNDVHIMLSTAFGETPGVPAGSPPLPDHPLLVMYEYAMPQRMPPLGPL